MGARGRVDHDFRLPRRRSLGGDSLERLKRRLEPLLFLSKLNKLQKYHNYKNKWSDRSLKTVGDLNV